VWLAQAQLRRVLDGDDALARVDEARQRVEQRRLAGAGPPADEQVAAAPYRPRQQLGQRGGQGPVLDQLLGAEAAAPEAADGQDGAVERERRDDDIDARAVRDCVRATVVSERAVAARLVRPCGRRSSRRTVDAGRCAILAA
jgi:hypothetical protein